ncbi:hypothetical protein AVEN_48620-1 [Araneus ventricosus]|uniref:Uncharacterized protein n=1 Tax=Araneus ventricosus TaxID=182803 RepID=A0A4Y2IXC1_ARAVE|nr:hypothetical protein AVEN_48620-1 [Araneus ventricosus]
MRFIARLEGSYLTFMTERAERKTNVVGIPTSSSVYASFQRVLTLTKAFGMPCSKKMERNTGEYPALDSDTGAPMISDGDVGPLTPENVRPLKKAESRKKIGKNRRWKKGTTAILTDSPNLKVLKEKKESLERKI